MRCDQVRELLAPFAAGELGALTARRLRRHLASCAACAAERESFRRLDVLLREADVVPAGRVEGTREASAIRLAPVSRPRYLAIGATAVAAVAAVGTLVLFGPGLLGRPSPAYAQVEQAMASVRTAHWIETEFWGDGGTGISTGVRNEVWARLDPPAIVRRGLGTRSGGDLGLNDPTFQTSSLKTGDGFRQYSPESGVVEWMPFEGSTPQGGAYSLRAEIQSKLFLSPRAVSAMWARAETERVMLEGRPALRFTFRGRQTFPNGRPNQLWSYSLWADAESKRVLRTEQRSTDERTGRLEHRVVNEGFSYDAAVPDRAFALPVPPGTPVYHQNYMWERGSSITVTPAEKKRLLEIVADVQQGLLHADWKRFSAGWDFDYVSALPNSCVPPGGLKRTLRRKVEASRGAYTTVRVQNTSGLNAAPYTRAMGFGDVSLPPNAPPLIALTLLSGIQYRDSFVASGMETFYFRREGASDFRLVGWQYPYEKPMNRLHQKWLATRAIRPK